MPRALRSDFAGEIYHALNRGNARNKIFFKDSDFETFERVIQQGLEKYPVDLIAYQWMSNHWHMVLSPRQDKAMSAFLGWVTMTLSLGQPLELAWRRFDHQACSMAAITAPSLAGAGE